MLSTYQKQKDINQFKNRLNYINTKANFESVDDRKIALEHMVNSLEKDAPNMTDSEYLFEAEMIGVELLKK